MISKNISWVFCFPNIHFLWVVHLTLSTQFVFSQAVSDSESLLTIDRIFASSEFYPRSSFGPAVWSEDGSYYTTIEPSGALEKGQDIIQYDVETGARSILVSATDLVPNSNDEGEPLAIEDYMWNSDESYLMIYTNSARVWRQNTKGDYWVLHLASKKLRQLGGPDAAPSTLMFAKFSPDGLRIAYVREHNLYVESLEKSEITQLTFDGSEEIINGTFDWVYEEELSLQDGFRWNSSGTHIAYWHLDASEVRDFYLLNTTDSLYSYVVPIQYPKVGEENSAAKIGVVSAEGGETSWMDLPGDPTNHYLARMDWIPEAEALLVQQLNRAQDTNLVWRCAAASGECEVILTETDEAWIDLADHLLWMNNGEDFIWLSERDGWSHVYQVSLSTQAVRLLTPGDYDVIELLQVNEQEQALYFIASPENATQRFLYRQSMKDEEDLKRLTPAIFEGIHQYQLAPDAAHAFHTYSTITRPPSTDLISLPDHERLRKLAEDPKLEQQINKLTISPPEFFQVTTEDQVVMDAWIIRPPDMDSSRQYPVIFYAYSEPAGQVVLDRYDFRNYLWHQLLAQQGYVVLAVDNRGTPAPKGRKWRKIIHKKIGQLNPADQAKAAKVILSSPQLDSSRVGIWGWSGGGTATLNALFQYPSIYQVGVSVAPVTFQLFYDNIYQERYMGPLTQENINAYIQGSPISHVQNFAGKLLLIHGTGDDNVHYQNSEVLINALIRLNMPFDMMAYPNRSHGIYEGYNTTRHLRTKITAYFLTHLPPGPK